MVALFSEGRRAKTTIRHDPGECSPLFEKTLSQATISNWDRQLRRTPVSYWATVHRKYTRIVFGKV